MDLGAATPLLREGLPRVAPAADGAARTQLKDRTRHGVLLAAGAVGTAAVLLLAATALASRPAAPTADSALRAAGSGGSGLLAIRVSNSYGGQVASVEREAYAWRTVVEPFRETRLEVVEGAAAGAGGSWVWTVALAARSRTLLDLELAELQGDDEAPRSLTLDSSEAAASYVFTQAGREYTIRAVHLSEGAPGVCS